MKQLFLSISILFISCIPQEEKLTGETIIKKSIEHHDPNNQWKSTHIRLHIQEPRIENPGRYSILHLNNINNSFELKRNREKHISTHKITADKTSVTLLDNKIVTDTTLIKKYRLEPKRNVSYQRFYQMLVGLPMSLTENEIEQISTPSEVFFNNTKSYKVAIKLKEALFSKHWNLFFSANDFSIIGLEMIFPENSEKGERLIFEGKITLNKTTIPRIKHWYELNNTYSGSDIIIKNLTNFK